MRRALASSLLSLLLLTTLVWGGCVSCEQFFMWTGAKGCCAPDGHCKTKKAPTRGREQQCKQIAFDHQKSGDHHVALPVAATESETPASPILARLAGAETAETNGPSP